MEHRTSDPIRHTVSLSFTYGDERRARVVEDAVAVEVGDIDDARSRATVHRDGGVVEVRIEATDLVALRAGLNSWTRLVDVAETVASATESKRSSRA